MRKALLTVTTASMVLLGSAVASAQDDNDGMEFVPVETYTCNYRDGKGPADLDKAIAGWNAYMDKQGDSDYLAMTMVPVYFGDETFDIGWLGANSSGAAMGAGHDNWFAKGAKEAAAFNSVIDCTSHSNFATTMVKQPPERTSPDNLVLTFSDCSVNEGNTLDDVFAGMGAWAAYTAEQGYTNGMWLMFPAYGVADADFDFKRVNGYDSHADMGKDYDRYGTGGDWVTYNELVGDLVSCDVSRVYNATVRRRSEDTDD